MGLFGWGGLGLINRLSRKIDKLAAKIEAALKDISRQATDVLTEKSVKTAAHNAELRKLDRKLDVLEEAAHRGDKLLATLRGLK
jgi:ubiquinone biosynthesis protein UbiJ